MKTKLNRVVLGHIGISTPSGNAMHKFLQNHDEGEIKCRFANWREVTKIYINTKYRQSFQYLHINLNLTKRHGSNKFKLKSVQLLIRTRVTQLDLYFKSKYLYLSLSTFWYIL